MKSPQRIIQLIALIMTLLVVASAASAVMTTPSTVNAAYGQSTSVTVHYQFFLPDVGGPVGPFISPYGEFCLPGTVTACNPIGRVSTTLTATSRRTSEVLTIPQGVIERALRAGFNNFSYVRNFANYDTFVLNINITPSSVAAFSLRRIELYFDSVQRRNEIMVDRNLRGLRAYADIYYNGSGFLNGFWEVDGLIIERVNRFVPSGGKVTLATPNVPDLPTFDPGYHIVKFVVTSPETSFEVPEMVYWVKGAEEPLKQALALLRPADGQDVPPDFLFEWMKMDRAAVYLINFAGAEDKKVRFSAMTRDTSYRVPPAVLADYFSSGTPHLWSVTGYDTENNVIAESKVQSFYFREEVKP